MNLFLKMLVGCLLMVGVYGCGDGNATPPTDQPINVGRDSLAQVVLPATSPCNGGDTCHYAQPLLFTIILELRLGILPEDLEGPAQTVKLCPDGKGGADREVGKYTDQEMKGFAKKGCEVVNTGEDNLRNEILRELFDEEALARYQAPTSRIQIQTIKACSPRIQEVVLDFGIRVDGMSNIAKKKSTRPQGDSGTMLNSLGFNYPVHVNLPDETLFKNTWKSQPECNLAVAVDYDAKPDNGWNKLWLDYLKGDLKDRSRVLNTLTPFMDCEPSFVFVRPVERDNVKIAIIDTGVDNWYGFSQRPQSPFFTVGTNVDGEYDTQATIINGQIVSEGFLRARINDDSRFPDFTRYNCVGIYGYDFIIDHNFPYDAHGHGTFLADIILSLGSEKTRITALKIGESENNDSAARPAMDLTAAVAAIHYAIDEGVDMINISWGYNSPEDHVVLRSAIQRAADAGIIMVISAGNSGTNLDECYTWPAAYSQTFPDNVITVGALGGDSPDAMEPGLAAYSSFGDLVTVAAPGTLYGGIRNTRTEIGAMQGTSFAAAYVTREVARLLENSASPLTVSEILDRLSKEGVLVANENVCVSGNRVLVPTRAAMNQFPFNNRRVQ